MAVFVRNWTDIVNEVSKNRLRSNIPTGSHRESFGEEDNNVRIRTAWDVSDYLPGRLAYTEPVRIDPMVEMADELSRII